MLVLNRKSGQIIVIGTNTTITIDDVTGNDVTVTIDSPGKRYTQQPMRRGDWIEIDDQISVFLLRGGQHWKSVKVGITAPRGTTVDRLELWRRKQQEGIHETTAA